MKTLIILGLMLAFITGFLVSYASNHVYVDSEKPFFIGLSDEKQPSDWVKENQIQVYPDKVVINVANTRISQYADTGSMLPTFGENANGIRIVPSSAEQIKIGDIISFEKGDMLIVHRVIDKGVDEKGIYFITKGDNNPETDGKVYFENIKYVTIGVIY